MNIKAACPATDPELLSNAQKSLPPTPPVKIPATKIVKFSA
jgi:hypothetical protein